MEVRGGALVAEAGPEVESAGKDAIDVIVGLVVVVGRVGAAELGRRFEACEGCKKRNGQLGGAGDGPGLGG